MVWSCFPLIRSGQNHLARHSEKGKKTKRTKEEVGRKHQEMDRPGVRQVPEGSGERKIICGAPMTLAVKEHKRDIASHIANTEWCLLQPCYRTVPTSHITGGRTVLFCHHSTGLSNTKGLHWYLPTVPAGTLPPTKTPQVCTFLQSYYRTVELSHSITGLSPISVPLKACTPLQPDHRTAPSTTIPQDCTPTSPDIVLCG